MDLTLGSFAFGISVVVSDQFRSISLLSDKWLFLRAGLLILNSMRGKVSHEVSGFLYKQLFDFVLLFYKMKSHLKLSHSHHWLWGCFFCVRKNGKD